jgi:2-polyprenyl-3-methyl-5-hydroxy-6-metoxy-1,4-benzoquinol methylase
MKPYEYDTMHELEDTHWWYVALHGHIIKVLNQHFNDDKIKVLDLGCGTGGLLLKLSNFLPNAYLVGSDLVALCCQRSSSKAGVHTVQSNSNQMPFGHSIFNAVIAADLIYHRNVNQSETLYEIWSSLKIDGIVIVNVPAYQWMEGTHDEHVQGVRRYTKPELQILLNQNGFEVIFSTYWNSFLFPLMILNRKILGVFRTHSDLGKLPPILEFVFNRILRYESLIINLGIRFPFGGSVFAVAKKKANE